jgi:hypothetical protein
VLSFSGLFTQTKLHNHLFEDFSGCLPDLIYWHCLELPEFDCEMSKQSLSRAAEGDAIMTEANKM